MKNLTWFLETMDTGTDIANFPRTLYQGSLEPNRHMSEHVQSKTETRAQVGNADGEWDRENGTTEIAERG